MKEIKPKYSGKLSIEFWNIVNNEIRDEADRQEIYSLGVALQNLECYVLKRLNDSITTTDKGA